MMEWDLPSELMEDPVDVKMLNGAPNKVMINIIALDMLGVGTLIRTTSMTLPLPCTMDKTLDHWSVC